MKLGFASLPFTGHLNFMVALARKMRSRGHEVVFIGIPDIEPTIRDAGLTFIPLAKRAISMGGVQNENLRIQSTSIALVDEALEPAYDATINRPVSQRG